MTVVKSYEELGRSPIVGDRVVISICAETHRFWAPGMRRFIGTIMTIRHIDESKNIIKMAEDIDEYRGNRMLGWDWFLPMFDGVVIDCVEEIDEDPSVWTGGLSIDDLLTS